jgi:hypothetical protein
MTQARFLIIVGSLVSLLALAGCGEVSVAAPQEEPAKVEPIGDGALSRITLTERAAERIGIRTAPVRSEAVSRVLNALGEVVAAKGSTTAVEVRVAMNAGDFNRVDHAATARVLPKPEGDAGAVSARLLREEQAAGYGDGAVYYAPDAKAQGLLIGQRPRVQVPLKGSGSVRLTVPYAAILYDASGRTWVYTNPEGQAYVRAAVKVDYVDGDVAVLEEGPAAGTRIVTVGASELYGAEVGVGE